MNIKSIIKNVLRFFSAIPKSDKSKILYYHDVYDNVMYTDMGTTLELFKQHIDVIKGMGFELVPEIDNNRKQIKICFDDGFKGIWDCREFFIANKIKPTVFIAVELIGKDGYLSIEEIKELQKNGFKFQCHSWSHNNLTTFSESELDRELVDSKLHIENIIGASVDEICFPMGYFNDLVYNKCIEAGYKKLYSSLSGPYDKNFKPNMLCRYLVQHSSANEARQIINGGDDIFYKWNLKRHYVKQ